MKVVDVNKMRNLKKLNSLNNVELKRLQNIELDILKIFIKICEKFNLRYYIIGGTMLGAVRHKGFIPWDNDVDVGMPRPDYERFLNTIEGLLPEGYEFLNYKTNYYYKRYFSKIVNKKAKLLNASYANPCEEYAWIDIFQMDGMPSGILRQKLHYVYMTLFRFFYHASCFEELVNLNRQDRKWYLKIAIKFLAITHIGRNLDTKSIMLKIEKLLIKYSYDDSLYIVNFFGQYMFNEIIEKRIIGIYKKYKFEDLMLNGPEMYEEYLSRLYGDYMTPPSDIKKIKQNILKIEFN